MTLTTKENLYNEQYENDIHPELNIIAVHQLLNALMQEVGKAYDVVSLNGKRTAKELMELCNSEEEKTNAERAIEFDKYQAEANLLQDRENIFKILEDFIKVERVSDADHLRTLTVSFKNWQQHRELELKNAPVPREMSEAESNDWYFQHNM